MEKSETIGQLALALAKARLEFPDIPKTKTGKIKGEGKGGAYEYSYKYSDLADVVPQIDPVLERHGLSYVQFPDVNERGDDGLTTVVVHESGEWMSGFMRLYLAKANSQAHGSAITYARRYALCCALGIVADEDDDGRAASQNDHRPAKSGQRQQSGQQRRSEGKAQSGAPAMPEDIAARIAALTDEQAGEIAKRIADNNFPTPLPGAAVKVVTKWIEEAEQGAPF